MDKKLKEMCETKDYNKLAKECAKVLLRDVQSRVKDKDLSLELLQLYDLLFSDNPKDVLIETNLDYLQELAHKQYEERRKELIEDLSNNFLPSLDEFEQSIIKRTIEFLKEKEI